MAEKFSSLYNESLEGDVPGKLTVENRRNIPNTSEGDAASLPPRYSNISTSSIENLERYISLHGSASNPQPDSVAEEGMEQKTSKKQRWGFCIGAVLICIIGGGIGAGVYFALKKTPPSPKVVDEYTTAIPVLPPAINNPISHQVSVKHCTASSTTKLYGSSGSLEVTSYDHNADCTFFIYGPINKTMVFTVEDVDASNDKVLFTVHESSSMTYYSGKRIKQENITFGMNYIIVQIKSDAKIAGTGFKGHWTSVNYEDILCKGRKNITGTNGMIESNPGVTQYAINMDCQWMITVPENNTIVLDLIEVNIASDDTLIIYDTASGDTKPVFDSHTLQGIRSVSISGVGRRLFISFTTNSGHAGNGFKALYTAIPTKLK